MTTSAICFFNPGAIDKRAFTMLGLSAKEGDKSKKIGFFGTGFKYALAVLLREHHEVEIVCGDQRYTFDVEEEDFRGTSHNFIKCHIEQGDSGRQSFELPYTTHLGTNWDLWQAYRELYTNALDEQGGVMRVDNYLHHSSEVQWGDGVYIYVVGEKFEEVYKKRDKYFLNSNMEEIAGDATLRAVAKKSDSDNVVYYKGMYTGTKLNRETFFTYDFVSHMTLTEDRTIKDTWYIEHHIIDLWTSNMSCDDLIKYLPKIAHDKYYENHFSPPSYPGKAFIRACEHLVLHKRPMPTWALRAFVKSQPLGDRLSKIKLLKHESVMLARACSILEYSGVSLDMSKITFVLELPERQLGLYDIEDQHIYISRALFEGGMNRLVGTLYEEWLHMTKDVEDNSRQLQNLLIDKCANLMERIYDADTTA